MNATGTITMSMTGAQDQPEFSTPTAIARRRPKNACHEPWHGMFPAQRQGSRRRFDRK